MSKTEMLTDQRIDFLENALEYFIFARLWWDDCGLDIVAWWKSKNTIRKTVMMTGEVCSYSAPKVLSDEEIGEDEFASVLHKFQSRGILNIQSQHAHKILNHYNIWYGFKKSEFEKNWIYVAGGIHADDAVLPILDAVYDECPEMLETKAVT